MKMDSSFLKKLAVPAAVLPFLAPMAAFAAEGTGRVSLMNLNHNDYYVQTYPAHNNLSNLKFSMLLHQQAFGIDDGRLIFAALAPSVIIFPLYLQWSSQQESDDFFDGYEKRRQG